MPVRPLQVRRSAKGRGALCPPFRDPPAIPLRLSFRFGLRFHFVQHCETKNCGMFAGGQVLRFPGGTVQLQQTERKFPTFRTTQRWKFRHHLLHTDHGESLADPIAAVNPAVFMPPIAMSGFPRSVSGRWPARERCQPMASIHSFTWPTQCMSGRGARLFSGSGNNFPAPAIEPALEIRHVLPIIRSALPWRPLRLGESKPSSP